MGEFTRSQIKMMFDGECSRSTRIVLKDYTSASIATFACHSIKLAPYFYQTTIGEFTRSQIKMMFDGECSRSTRIVLEDYTSVIIAPLDCHSIKLAPYFNQTTLGAGPRSAIKLMLNGECSRSTRIVLEDYTSVIIAPLACHPVKLVPNFYQTTKGESTRSQIKMMFDGVCSQSTRIVLEDYTSVIIAPYGSHSIKLAP
ncbi:MAG: hypothetical protein KIPDCIKN_00633 [Haliscomenobacter sp.]|nr:hypothetical protein [Haliscomenobacter sp.]